MKSISLALAVAALAVVPNGARASIIALPCETCGVALGKALPEGVTFLDLESYGQRDGQANRLGVNIPTFAWSTPISFYDTRLEVLAIVPVSTSVDGATMNRVDYYASSIIFGGAHDFGNGFHAAVFAGPRSADNNFNIGRGASADLRASFVYEKDGFQAIATVIYSGSFGGVFNQGYGAGPLRYDDNVFVDYTLSKTFGKFELGIVGFAQEDIVGPVAVKPASVAVGGLVGYDFGAFKLQGYVTREVAIRAGGFGLGPSTMAGVANGGEETRGYFRVQVPLYVAPKAPTPVTARY